MERGKRKEEVLGVLGVSYLRRSKTAVPALLDGNSAAPETKYLKSRTVTSYA